MLFLSDIPASFPPTHGGDNSSLYLLVLAGAIPSIVGLLVNLFQWLGRRTVEREDEDKKKLELRISKVEDTIEARFEKHDITNRLQIKEQSEQIIERIEKLEKDVRQDMSRQLGDTMRAVNELRDERGPRKPPRR